MIMRRLSPELIVPLRRFISVVMLAVTVAAFATTSVAPGATSAPARAATSPPSVSISSPSNGSTVKGSVTITATATANSGDEVVRINFNDGANGLSSYYCDGGQTCTGSIQWDATGLSGQHSITASASTYDGYESTSSAVVVNVQSPAPTVTIDSPKAGATVAGTITVQASAATDPSQSDYPDRISVSDGVNSIGDIYCQGQQTCSGSVQWQATGLSGPHTLTATVQTDNELVVTSPGTTVTVVSPPPTVRITSPHTGALLGRVIRVSAAGKTDPSQNDYPSRISISDGANSIGDIYCQGQQTCSGSVEWDRETSGAAMRFVRRSRPQRALRDECAHNRRRGHKARCLAPLHPVSADRQASEVGSRHVQHHRRRAEGNCDISEGSQRRSIPVSHSWARCRRRSLRLLFARFSTRDLRSLGFR